MLGEHGADNGDTCTLSTVSSRQTKHLRPTLAKKQPKPGGSYIIRRHSHVFGPNHIFLHIFLSHQIKQTQDEEKKQLTALRDLIKSSLQLDQKEVGHQPGQVPTPGIFSQSALSGETAMAVLIHSQPDAGSR